MGSAALALVTVPFIKNAKLSQEPLSIPFCLGLVGPTESRRRPQIPRTVGIMLFQQKEKQIGHGLPPRRGMLLKISIAAFSVDWKPEKQENLNSLRVRDLSSN